jgi:hypothetical protein
MPDVKRRSPAFSTSRITGNVAPTATMPIPAGQRQRLGGEARLPQRRGREAALQAEHARRRDARALPQRPLVAAEDAGQEQRRHERDSPYQEVLKQGLVGRSGRKGLLKLEDSYS